MPELPEVETIRNGLKKKILGKKIIAVIVKKKKIIHQPINSFLKIIKNNSFSDIQRTGKLLIFILADKENYLLIHLRMTGQLILKNKISEPEKHTHVIFTFKDKTQLFFNDLRQFGYMRIVKEEKLKKIKSKYGIEPLTKNFTLKNFAVILKKAKKPIKSVLLDQALISGLGNIYADETCFHAGINPFKKAKQLNRQEISTLFLVIQKIIKKAIKHNGSSVKDYLDASGKKGDYVRFLAVYGREGKKCLKCGSIIKKTKLSGRGTSYCPICQK